MARKPRNYFFESPDSSQGTRFSRFNHPTKEIFQLLFGSLLFPENTEDAAKENEAGHVRLTTDESAMDRISSYKDGHSHVLRPEQQGMLIAKSDESEVFRGEQPHVGGGIKITPIEKTISGNRKRLSYKVEVNSGKSIIVTQDGLLQLLNDIVPGDESQDNGKFYGITGTEKGFYRVLPNYTAGWLKCYKDENDTYVISWEELPEATVASNVLLMSADDTDLPASPINPIIKSHSMPAAAIKDKIIKVSAVVYFHANENKSSAYLRLRKGSGNTSSVPLTIVKDGNTTGYATLKAEINCFSDGETIPIRYVASADSMNSSEPVEHHVTHYYKWSHDGQDTSDLILDVCGEREFGSARITLVKLNIEKA